MRPVNVVFSSHKLEDDEEGIFSSVSSHSGLVISHAKVTWEAHHDVQADIVHAEDQDQDQVLVGTVARI